MTPPSCRLPGLRDRHTSVRQSRPTCRQRGWDGDSPLPGLRDTLGVIPRNHPYRLECSGGRLVTAAIAPRTVHLFDAGIRPTPRGAQPGLFRRGDRRSSAGPATRRTRRLDCPGGTALGRRSGAVHLPARRSRRPDSGPRLDSRRATLSADHDRYRRLLACHAVGVAIKIGVISRLAAVDRSGAGCTGFITVLEMDA